MPEPVGHVVRHVSPVRQIFVEVAVTVVSPVIVDEAVIKTPSTVYCGVTTPTDILFHPTEIAYAKEGKRIAPNIKP